MQKYKVLWDRSDYGSIIIEAKSAEDAREMFETGEWEEKDLNIKNSDMHAVNIEKVTD